MIVLGIDPGKTTGFAKLYSGISKPNWFETQFFNDVEWQHIVAHYFKLSQLISNSNVIVMESAIHHGRLTDGKIHQLKVIGIVEYLCGIMEVNLVYVTPEEGKKHKIDVSHIHAHHSKDAYRVAMAYLIREGKVNVADYLSTKGS